MAASQHAIHISLQLCQAQLFDCRSTVDRLSNSIAARRMAPKGRKRSSMPEATNDTLRYLSQCGTRTGLSNALVHLSDAGWLRPNVMQGLQSGARRKLSRAMSDHANVSTPYGTVIQQMRLPLRKLPLWDYAHPLALLYHLATISTAFGDLMAESVVPGVPMRVVIYIDEICPGNPLRPDKARTLQAIYWCLADWPQWVLQRTAAWPCFGTIRSSIVKDLPGGVAQLMKLILNVFWPPTGDSFMNGVTIFVRSMPIIVTGIFAGFLADEKAHKELTGTKGASGSKICITCNNVFNRVKESALVAGTVCIACCDPGLFQYNTNASIYEAYDHIAANHHDSDLQQCLGLKYEPNGLLHDAHIRTIYKPVDHTLRDWQHTIVGGGVANVECARVLAALSDHGISLDVVTRFLLQFKLPKVHGKVEPSWLATKRLGKKWKSLQSFASTLLSLIPIMAVFLLEVIDEPAHPLYDHMQCFWRLRMIVGILQLGPSNAMQHVQRLRQLIREHAELFTTLYAGHEKPKFHHLFHIVDNMLFLGKLLSCFVTERKHRTTKRCALFVFRCIESVVIKDMTSRQCEQIRSESESIFAETYMVRSKPYNIAGSIIHRALGAVLPCGSLHAGDFVWLNTNVVALVISFWRVERAKHISLQVETYRCLNDRATQWRTESNTIFVGSECVVSALIYSRTDESTLFVIPAASSYL